MRGRREEEEVALDTRARLKTDPGNLFFSSIDAILSVARGG